MKKNLGFTLVELLVVISIIALLSSVVFATLTKARVKARDSARIQVSRQIALALEQYEQSTNSYKVTNSGYNNEGGGYIAKGAETPGYTNSILSTLKQAGYMSSGTLKDPVYGTDNYYLGLCTSTNAYNIFVKLEQSEYNNSTTSISNTCGGAEAANLGFNFIASTVGGTSGGGGSTSGLGGYYESGMSAPVIGQDGLTYGAVTAEDGRVWLDRNLGATRVATAYDDYLAYGSKFQWGRGNDGHQLVNYTSATVGTSVNGSTSTMSSADNPGHSLFITTSVERYDWKNPRNDSLWQGLPGVNNPCPTEFRIPTQAEIANLVSKAGITNANTALNSSLKLTVAGNKNFIDTSFQWMGQDGYYWSSDINSYYVRDLSIHLTSVNVNHTDSRSLGASVRCIKN